MIPLQVIMDRLFLITDNQNLDTKMAKKRQEN